MWRARSLLGYLAAWLFTALYWLPLVVLGTVTAGWFTRRCFAPLVHVWARTVLLLLGIRVEIEGASGLQGAASRVVLVNHQSTLDVLWAALLAPPGALAIGKRELIYIPVVNVLWWILDFVRVDRRDTHKAVRSLAGLSQRVREQRRTLFVAPEGTRTPSGEMLAFKKGAFWIAMESRAPIVPVVVHGAFELLPKDRFLARAGTIRVRVLPPIATDGWTREDLDRHIATVRDVMVSEHAKLRSAAVS